MLIGLSGTHRSGKTTLAHALTTPTGLAFYDGSFGALSRRLGYDSVSKMTLAERMRMQHEVLDLYAREVRELDRPSITDRTPVDMMAYTLAEVGMHSATNPDLARMIVAYRERCVAMTGSLFRAVVLLQPLPTYAADPDKPPENVAYQWHVQTLIEGGLFALSGSCRTLRIDTWDMERRIAEGREIVGGLLARPVKDMVAA